MERYRKLLKRKGYALAAFEQTKKELADVCTQLDQSVAQAKDLILKKKAEIEAEEQAIAFAMNEMNVTQNTIKKIEALIS